jgi:hypothetical protein
MLRREGITATAAWLRDYQAMRMAGHSKDEASRGDLGLTKPPPAALPERVAQENTNL